MSRRQHLHQVLGEGQVVVHARPMTAVIGKCVVRSESPRMLHERKYVVDAHLQLWALETAVLTKSEQSWQLSR